MPEDLRVLKAKDILTRADFDKSTKRILEVLLKNQQALREALARIRENNEKILQAVIKETEQRLEKDFSGKFTSLFNQIVKENQKANEQFAEQKKLIERALEELQERIASIQDGKDADEEKIIERVRATLPTVEDIENNLPKLGERIRDALELLQGDNRLDINAIKGLKEDLEDRFERVRAQIASMRSIGRARIQVTQRVDLSDQCDGVTKTFNLGRKDVVAVLGVFSTQFPVNYNFSGDWTLSGSQLTLGDDVDAPASGQTLWCLVDTLFYK